MAGQTWGIPTTRADRPRGRRRLPAGAAEGAHRGLVWLHAGAVVLWLGMLGVLWLVVAGGRDVPAVAFIACAGAAGGHALFAVIHRILAGQAHGGDS